ncbi:MAG: DegT/DnrJ/EryC1/StrS aminotransferase family protein [Ignavibacteriae bacterium]|nr:DegT/DnrJ/EryC1/StrS aminotransferase family protein [Ignavibacteriota bacterium]
MEKWRNVLSNWRWLFIAMKIPHSKPWITKEDEHLLLEVVRSGWLADGKQPDLLRKKLLQFLDLGGDAVITSSGSSSLFIALKALKLQPQSKIAIPTYSCRALLDAVLLANHIPVFVDVNRDFNMRSESLKEIAETTGKVDAIIAVNTHGKLCELEALKKYSLHIIEDCCHSIGTRSKQSVIPDAKVFSFYATKVITGGQGGAIWSKDPQITEFAHTYLEKEILPRNYTEGFNLRISDLHAAIANNQLDRIDEVFIMRSNLAKRYFSALPEKLKNFNHQYDPNRLYYRFVIQFQKESDRNLAFDYFIENNITVSKLYQKEELLHNCYHSKDSHISTAESLVKTSLSIPLYPSLDRMEEEKIISLLKNLNYDASKHK